MIWVVGFILIILGIFAFWIDEDFLGIGSVFLGVGWVISVVIIITMVVNGRTIDRKIEMYTEENTKIETSISEVVKQYMKFESDTLIELKSDSVINLVSLYPELKSDELVKTQIEVYQANNKKIKELREEKINISNYKWWLYFGK